MLPPVADVALFGDELGRVAAVGLEEVDSFLPFGEPEFILGHSYCNQYYIRYKSWLLSTSW